MAKALKVRKFWGPISTFVEVTWEKPVGAAFLPPPPILNRVNILFVPHDSEEIKLPCKSNYNKRKNQVILIMISNKADYYYYFAVKNLSELKSLG